MAEQLPPDYEIVGISLIGPPPLEYFHLRWENALTVLYGPNGAGKTMILNGVERALGSSRLRAQGKAYLHIRITEDADPLDWASEYFTLDLVAMVTKWLQSDFWNPDGLFYFEEHGHDWAAHEKLLESSDAFDAIATAITGQRPDLDLGQGIADAVRQARTITLLAEGESTWKVLPSVPPSHFNDAVRTYLRELKPLEWEIQNGKPVGRETCDKFPLTMHPSPSDEHGILLTKSQPPSWVPIPVAIAGSVESPWGPDVIGIGDEPIDVLTQRYILGGGAGNPREVVTTVSEKGGQLFEVSPKLTEVLDRISDLANNILATTVPEFPSIAPRVHEAPEWIEGRFMSWTAIDRPSGAMVPLSSLSEAQRRWTTLAIQIAIWAGRTRSPYSAMLIDEPELALHAQAAHKVASELVDLSSSSRLPVVVTSHSPAFLDQADAHLVHVFRGVRGQTQTQALVDTVGGDLDGAFQRLGLRRSDLLQLSGVFTVVEGEHDRVVLEELFGERLTSLRTSILVMRGSNHALSLFDSQLLVRYTDAALVVVLDGRHDDKVVRAWTRARSYAEKGDVAKAISAFERSTTSCVSHSEQVFKEIALKSFEIGRWTNLYMSWLSKPDIAYYLNPPDLDARLPDWDELQPDYLSSRQEGEDIKAWLRRVHSVKVNTKTIRHAASRLDRIHPDLTDVLMTIEQAADNNRAS